MDGYDFTKNEWGRLPHLLLTVVAAYVYPRTMDFQKARVLSLQKPEVMAEVWRRWKPFSFWLLALRVTCPAVLSMNLLQRQLLQTCIYGDLSSSSGWQKTQGLAQYSFLSILYPGSVLSVCSQLEAKMKDWLVSQQHLKPMSQPAEFRGRSCFPGTESSPWG